ncbi:MAG: sulfatase-like hydrolase/transferase [Candidatus Glassbacteria bacterium]
MSSEKDSFKGGMTRREFLAAAGAASLAAAGGLSGQRVATSARDMPNILIIITDQLSQKAVGAYGDKQRVTPHIDALAKSGVRFSSSYTNCPLCQPSRASFWTGRMPSQTGVNSNGLNYPVPAIKESTATLGEIFSRAGYETVHFGKQHDAGALRGFRLVEPEKVELEASAAFPVDSDSQQDPPTADRCIEYIKAEHNRPFLAVASLNNPHNICNWVGEFEGPDKLAPIPDDQLPLLPENFEIADLAKRPLPIQYLCCSHRRLRMASKWSDKQYRQYLAAYYHYVALADEQIGRIVQALRNSPAGGNALIIFFSDHGDGMASHRMVTKQVSFYEETTRIPLIFSGTGLAGYGRMLLEPLTSLVDLLPTLCDFAGLEAPRDLPGMSLTPWLRGENVSSRREYVVSEWQTEWGYTVEPGRMLRTDRFKYTSYLEGTGEEFYDLENDPGEKRNLAFDGYFRKPLVQHREMLRRHVLQTRDPFFGQAVQVDKRWRSHKLGYPNHEGPSAPEAAWAEQGKMPDK